MIARESGGNSQVMNLSGHYGLYQFSASTWAEYGGSPALFGHAERSRAGSGSSTMPWPPGAEYNWSPYDGC